MNFDEKPEKIENLEHTDWGMVFLAASEDPAVATSARAAIYRRYGPAVYSWARSHCRETEDAKDLTQSFFAKIIAENWFARARQERGKFRSFMTITLERFARDNYRKKMTAKRGGKVEHLPIHLEEVMARAEAYRKPGNAPDAAFRQGWASVVMEDSLDALRRKYEVKDELFRFETLSPWLAINDASGEYPEAAAALGLTADATRAAVLRFRGEYRTALWSRVAEDLNTRDLDEIRAELMSLAEAC